MGKWYLFGLHSDAGGSICSCGFLLSQLRTSYLIDVEFSKFLRKPIEGNGIAMKTEILNS